MMGWVPWIVQVAAAGGATVVAPQVVVMPAQVDVIDLLARDGQIQALVRSSQGVQHTQLAADGRPKPSGKPVALPKDAQDIHFSSFGLVIWRTPDGRVHTEAGESVALKPAEACASCVLRAWDHDNTGFVSLWASNTQWLIQRGMTDVLLNQTLASTPSTVQLTATPSGLRAAIAVKDGWQIWAGSDLHSVDGCVTGAMALSGHWAALSCGQDMRLFDLRRAWVPSWTTTLELGEISHVALYEEADGGVTMALVATLGARIMTWPLAATGPIRWASRPLPGGAPLRWPVVSDSRPSRATFVLRLAAPRAVDVQGMVVGSSAFATWGTTNEKTRGALTYAKR